MMKYFASLFALSVLFAGVMMGQTTLYQHDFGIIAISGKPYTVAPGTLDANLSNSSWTTSATAFIDYGGSAGKALSLANSSGTPTYTLTFDVAVNYQLEVTSFSFWRQRSNTGAQNWAMTINGTSVGSGIVPTTGANTGSLTPTNAISGLTGTITVILSLSGASGTGSFRLDDFTLVGNVTSSGSPTLSATPLSLSSFSYVEGSGPSTSQSYNLSGTNLTGAPGNITVNGSTNYEVSDDDITFSSSVSVPYSSATLGATAIYVRLKAGLSAGNYSGETISNSGGGASTQNVTANGTVYKTEPANHATSFSSAAGSPSYSAINLSWTDASGGVVPDGYLIKGSTTSFSAIADPVDGMAESDGALVKNVAQGTEAASIGALDASTMYYFKIYPYTNSSSNINYKTDGTIPTTSLKTDDAPPATSLLEEDFSFSGKLTDNGWSAHSGGGTYPISTTTGLTYAGYANSGIGNAALIGNAGGEDVNLALSTEQTADGATIYCSFLVNVNDATSNKSGDYFFTMGDRVSETNFTAFAARVFARIVNDDVNFGISNTSTATYGTTNFVKNTVYLLVIKYTINKSGNDEVKLWILNSGVPANESIAGTPEVTNSTTAGTDVIDAISLRQGSSSSPQVVIDGIRVSDGWTEAPLPVELTSFTAMVKGKNVELLWKTATETQNAGFEIERSDVREGKSGAWKKIGFAEGAGTISTPKSYSYVDAGARGAVQYRLKQIDRDGGFHYSNSVNAVVQSIPQEYALIQNYPNPFNPTTQISYQLPVSGNVTLRVYNILGEEVALLVNGMQSAGEHTAQFDAAKLPSGIYFYTLQTAQFTKTMKMLLVK
ncbi:MAG: T9SS type A sorting domain-containing protein [Bacteroidetes bacterium]|nr:T9SS type A sorting domain-containing protein [Bacteroidota bacterium]